MSGHNKWSTIKNKKAKTDAQKGKIFTKIGREILIAVREGGGADPATNGKLRDVIAKAKANNMPNDNINRSIQKAAGEGNAANYKELTYEGYAPGGVAVILSVVTDNINRTASEVRHLFDKFGGQMGANGCVSWMFDFKGIIELEIPAGKDEDDIMMMALDAGAEDVTVDENIATVYTDPGEFSQVREALESAGLTFLSADRTMLPKNTVDITDPEMVEKVRKLLDVMEDDDDVQEVYHNAVLPEEEEEED